VGRMVRKQLYLDETQDRELGRRARLLGVTQAELVRRALDDFLSGERHSARDVALSRLKAGWTASHAHGVGSGGVRPTRDELHER